MTPYRFFCAGRYRRTIHCSSQERADAIARLRYGPTGRAISAIPVRSYHLPEPRIARGWLVALALAILGTVAVLHSIEPASMVATGR